MNTAEFNFTLSYPGNLLEHSFLDLTVTNSSIFPAGTILDAWCLDKSIVLTTGSTYTGYIYSAYEPPSISGVLPGIAAYVDKLDSVNWLLNYYDGSNPQYNWGEVQSAIWTLLGQDYRSELSYLQTDGAVLESDVDSLVSQALAQDGYRPGLGDSIAMIVDHVDANGEHNQPIVVEVKSAALGDRVWHDKNANGLQDAGEAGIAGAKVELVRDVNGDGVIGANEVLNTTTTDANGSYRFTGLTPGLQYQVRFTAPTGFDSMSPRQADGSSSSGANSDGALSNVVTLAAGEYNPTLDAGFYNKSDLNTASLGDKVWLDTNNNGLQDAGEVGAMGVKVHLLNAAGQTIATQTTDSNGGYLFTNLAAGQYAVSFERPAGYNFTKADAAGLPTDALDSDANTATGQTGLYTLALGEQNRTVDAGLVLAPTSTAPDKAEVCEDRSVTFNVLTNDSPGLRLVGVAHASSALDSTFNSRGGAISFNEDGQVTYKTMTNYYGNDKLVYTVEDAFGNRSTQTVDMTVKAVSDAMLATNSTRLHPANLTEWTKWYDDAKGVRHRVHVYKLSDFTAGSNDNADQLQTFGTYNTGVANDVDTVTRVRLSGLQGATASGAVIKFNDRVLDFSGGRTYDISVDAIRQGKLSIDIHTTHKNYDLKYQLGDSGTVQNNACYDGCVWSEPCHTYIGTPIALDLNGDGRIGVTGATSSYQKDAGAALGHTVDFDLNGDGTKETIEWFDGSGDGILIDNRDGNAAFDMSGLRLFGDQGGAFGNGYYKLQTLDTNQDGKLSGAELKGIELWVDNGDAVVQSGEIQTLAEHGIDAIGTQLKMTFDAEGKLHIESSATRTDGSTLLSEDVFFAGKDTAVPTLAEVLGDDASLDNVLGAAAPATTDVFAQCFTPDTAAMADVLRKIVAAQASAELAAV